MEFLIFGTVLVEENICIERSQIVSIRIERSQIGTVLVEENNCIKISQIASIQVERGQKSIM